MTEGVIGRVIASNRIVDSAVIRIVNRTASHILRHFPQGRLARIQRTPWCPDEGGAMAPLASWPTVVDSTQYPVGLPLAGAQCDARKVAPTSSRARSSMATRPYVLASPQIDASLRGDAARRASSVVSSLVSVRMFRHRASAPRNLFRDFTVTAFASPAG